jgi:hypothetical protein
MATSKSAPAVAARPSTVLRLAAVSVDRTASDWDLDRAKAAPATFGKALLGDLTERKASRRLPAQTVRDLTKAAGVYGRTPTAQTGTAWTASQARVAESVTWFTGAVDLLAALPNLAGVTIGRIPGVAADRALTLRDLLDGLTLPPSKSEVAAWLAGAE